MIQKSGPKHECSQPFPLYLAELAESGADGVLVVATFDCEREIHLISGEVRAVRSNAQTERLGSWLVAKGLLSDDDRVLSLLQQDEKSELPLGQMLVDQDLLEPETLDVELEKLALTIVASAASEPSEYCEFYEGPSETVPDILPDITTTQIILLAAREFDDHEVKEIAVGDFGQLIRKSNNLDMLILDLQLTPVEGFLISRLEGPRTLSDLESLTALPHNEIVETVFSLLTARLVKTTELVKTEPRRIGRPADFSEEAETPVVNESELSEGQVQERRAITARAQDLKKIDHYSALSLLQGAPGEDVRAAWTSIQDRYDPERTREPHLADMAKTLKAIVDRAAEAFEVLGKAASRDRYDRILATVEEERRQMAEGSGKHVADDRARTELVEANFKRADELVREGEVYLAVQLLDQACVLDPRPPQLLKLAKLMMQNPLWTNRALGVLKKCIEIDSSFADAWIELARFWGRRKDHERKRKALERALNADPYHEEANKIYKDFVGERELAQLLRRAKLKRK